MSSFSRHVGPNGPTYDICLMDIEMPVMNGVTACHQIRGLEKSGELVRRVPLIAVTANARQEQVTQSPENGGRPTKEIYREWMEIRAKTRHVTLPNEDVLATEENGG